MVHKGVSEEFARDFRAAQRLRRLLQGSRQFQRGVVLPGIRIALHHLHRLKLALNAQQPGPQGGRQDDVGVGVGGAQAEFHPLRFG